MDSWEVNQEKTFLGQEFLTWLWCRSESQEPLTLEQGRPVEIIIGDRMVLGPVAGREGARVTVRGRESSLAEAREALRRGKLVESLRLGLELGGEEFWLTLRAADLGVSSLKLPTPTPPEPLPGREPGLDRDGMVLERVALIGQVLAAVQQLFALFLEERLARPQEEGAARRLRDWIWQTWE